MTNDVFFDTDCISAFLWVDDTSILEKLFDGHIVFPEPVYRELCNPYVPHLKQRADRLINNHTASVRDIEVGSEAYNLYSSLVRGKNGQKQIGRGEASGIALAHTYNGILASNNYKDIAPYIDKLELRHTDTGQILHEALKRGIITEADGNRIWKEMLAKRRWLPASSFSEYLQSNT